MGRRYTRIILAQRKSILSTTSLGAALCLAGTLSVISGAQRAVSSSSGNWSTDFQWSPSRLLLGGVDPYHVRLAALPGIILTQSPNYLHLLYWVLAPLGALSFREALAIWLVVNLLLIALSVSLVVRGSELPLGPALVVTGLFLSSTPVRIGLANGQQSFLILACSILTLLLSKTAWSGLPLAISLTKYSFLPLVFTSMLRRQYRSIALATVVLSASLIAFAFHTETRLITALKEPFVLSNFAVGNGVGDAMTVLSLAGLSPKSGLLAGSIGIAVALVLSIATRKTLQSSGWLLALATVSVISLISFKHLVHDFVFLLPVVALSFTTPSRLSRIALWLSVAYLWFLYGPLLKLGAPNWTFSITVSAFVCLALIFVVLVQGNFRAHDGMPHSQTNAT